MRVRRLFDFAFVGIKRPGIWSLCHMLMRFRSRKMPRCVQLFVVRGDKETSDLCKMGEGNWDTALAVVLVYRGP